MKQFLSIRFLPLFLATFTLLAITTLSTVVRAQYFTSENTKTEILKASGHDSVVLSSKTPFEVPAVNDSISLTYHEPMPDSIMPRSAVVIGTITVQAEDVNDVVPMLEKYARKLGADWLVSFQEQKAVKTKDKWIAYRSQALLLHVLDDQFIDQNDIQYAYYEQQHFENYASLSHWFDMYGKGLGAR
ncbi:MAG TPA: hypothetical protein VGM92_11690 [Candidatus Kapabacteria bacterium]|jgi:hypothetical protein